MTPTPEQWESLKQTVTAQLGKPYLWGAKPDPKDGDPKNFDCSGFVHWAYGRCLGVAVPEGSWEQYDASVPIDGVQLIPQLGDVGFFKHVDAPYDVHHVGILLDAASVIEARGKPYDKVITRPRAIWEKWVEFTGWRRFKAIMQALLMAVLISGVVKAQGNLPPDPCSPNPCTDLCAPTCQIDSSKSSGYVCQPRSCPSGQSCSNGNCQPQGVPPCQAVPCTAVSCLPVQALPVDCVDTSTETYVYGFANGMDYERQIDLGRISSYILNCSTSTVFVSSGTPWDAGTCGTALMAAETDIYSLQFSTPPVIPPPAP